VQKKKEGKKESGVKPPHSKMTHYRFFVLFDNARAP